MIAKMTSNRGGLACRDRTHPSALQMPLMNDNCGIHAIERTNGIRWTKFATAALMGLTIIGQALAAEGTASFDEGKEPGQVTVTITNGAATCGIEVRFERGQTFKKRLDPAEEWKVAHRYTENGSYSIEVEGVTVFRGLRSAAPCSMKQKATATIAGNTASINSKSSPTAIQPSAATSTPKTPEAEAPTRGQAFQQAREAPATRPSGQNMIVLARKGTLQIVKTLDGNHRITNHQYLTNGAVDLCVVKFQNGYGNLSDKLVDDIVGSLLTARLETQTGGKRVALQNKACLFDGGGGLRLYGNPPFIVAERRALPLLLGTAPQVNDLYVELHEISPSDIHAFNERSTETARRRERDTSDRLQQIAALAQARSSEKIGSLAFDVPSSANFNYCTLARGDKEGSAVAAYIHRGHQTQSDLFRTQADLHRRSTNKTRHPTEVFPDLESLYAAAQTQRFECLVFVDYPANLQKVIAAMQRDGKRTFSIGEIVDVSVLRNEWAVSMGFNRYEEYEVSEEIKAGPQQFKALSSQGITTKAGFDAASKEMQSSGYASGNDVPTVLRYLNDKAQAKMVSGATALSVRDAREKADRIRAEASRAEERKRSEEKAREFPFIAVLTCGMPDHINILACFAGRSRGVDTELKLRNGTNMGIYKAYNFDQAGREQQDGFHIDLRRNFDLRAQNADRTLILGLKIIDRATGNVLYEDKAAQYGVVSMRN